MLWICLLCLEYCILKVKQHGTLVVFSSKWDKLYCISRKYWNKGQAHKYWKCTREATIAMIKSQQWLCKNGDPQRNPLTNKWWRECNQIKEDPNLQNYGFLQICTLRALFLPSKATISVIVSDTKRRITLFFPYERNTEKVRMPAPVGWGGLG